MPCTFDDLGIHFPLFAGPVEQATGYLGIKSCHLCKNLSHSFRLGFGGSTITSCPRCGANTAVPGTKGGSECVSCGFAVSSTPETEKHITACFTCLRDGKVALTEDTIYGMIRWSDAIEGRTHGVPTAVSEATTQHAFRTTTTSTRTLGRSSSPQAEPPWERKALPQEVMFELLRTPGYSTWQGEQWQFDGDAPMVYLGTWGRADFDARAQDGNGQAFFRRVVQDPPPGDWLNWLGEHPGEHGIAVYVFQTQDGQRIAAHYDMD